MCGFKAVCERTNSLGSSGWNRSQTHQNPTSGLWSTAKKKKKDHRLFLFLFCSIVPSQCYFTTHPIKRRTLPLHPLNLSAFVALANRKQQKWIHQFKLRTQETLFPLSLLEACHDTRTSLSCPAGWQGTIWKTANIPSLTGSMEPNPDT